MEGPAVAGICVFIEFIMLIGYAVFASNKLRNKIIKMGRLIPAVQVVVVNAATVTRPGVQPQYQNVPIPQPYGQPAPQPYGQPSAPQPYGQPPPQPYGQAVPEYEYAEVPEQPYSQTPPSYGLVPPPPQAGHPIGWQAPMEVPPPYSATKKY